MSLTKVTNSMISGAVVNVLDKGSTGACIQAAIDSLPATGGRVVVPDGTVLTVDSTVVVNKPLELILGSCDITFTDSIGIEQTSSTFTITGAGDQLSVLKHSGTSHCIYVHGTTGTSAGRQLGRFNADNVGLVDLLTSQPGNTFDTWSTTRTAGAGIFIGGTAGVDGTPQTNLKGINIFGFFDGVFARNILASTLDSVRVAWSCRDGISIGVATTSVTLTGCYSFASRRDGIHFEDNAWYCTINSCAADSCGRHGYYFGPGSGVAPSNGLSPFMITLNSPGQEEQGYVTAGSGGIYMDGVKSIIINAPLITGLGAASLTPTSGILFGGAVSSNVTINLGTYGFNDAYLQEYGINIPTGKFGGKLIIIGEPSSFAATLGNINDPDHVIQYLGGQFGYSTTFEATEVIAGGATPTLGTQYYYPIPDDTFVRFKVEAVAHQTAGAGGTIGQGAAYEFYASYRNIGGAVASVGPTTYAYAAENDATWTMDLTFASGGVVPIFTAAANETVTWRYSVTTMLHTL